MFIIKNNYYLYIGNTKDVDLNCIRKSKKISIIYRNNDSPEDIEKIISFKKLCKQRSFKFFVANDFKLAKNCKADGLYISSYNKKIYLNTKLSIMGAAHNFSEIYQKIKQGCDTIILSRLFKISYKNKKDSLGIVKFNLIKQNFSINIIPLGGINNLNLLKLNIVNSQGLALLSEIKKKPAITNRLF